MSLSQYEKLVKELRTVSTRDKEKVAELKSQKGKLLSGLLGPSAAAPGRDRAIGKERKAIKAKLDEINNG